MILTGNALSIPLRDESVDCCVTSPPYWGLRDYGDPDQIGLEPTPDEYVANMVSVFREVRRVLKPEGTLWLNLGDSYAQTGGSGPQGKSECWRPSNHIKHDRQRHPLIGLPPKSLIGIPWRVAFALQADGWILRSDIIWAKPNPMPESVRDRPTKSHEYLFMLAKSQRYYFDQDAVREKMDGEDRIRREAERGMDKCIGTNWKRDKSRNDVGVGMPNSQYGARARLLDRGGRNIRDVWTIATQPFPGAHFAVMPPKLVEPCIKAGCPEGGTVLDPFCGAGTVGLVADRLRRKFVGVELNHAFAQMAQTRIIDDCPLFHQGASA